MSEYDYEFDLGDGGGEAAAPDFTDMNVLADGALALQQAGYTITAPAPETPAPEAPAFDPSSFVQAQEQAAAAEAQGNREALRVLDGLQRQYGSFDLEAARGLAEDKFFAEAVEKYGRTPEAAHWALERAANELAPAQDELAFARRMNEDRLRDSRERQSARGRDARGRFVGGRQ